MTLETFMNGTKGFRAREAAAYRKNRSHRLTSEEVRAARFANLHGNAEPEPAVELEAVEPAAEVEVTVEAQPEQTDAPADEAGENADEAADEAGDEDAGEDEGEAEADADEAAPAEGEPATKKKAGKAKKKAGK